MNIRTIIVLSMAVPMLLACDAKSILQGNVDMPEDPGDPQDPGDPGDPQNPGDPMASDSRALVWKRYRAVEQDLSRALELEPSVLCNELGSLNCINTVHLSSLGGHDPFGQGRQTSLAEPVLTTPIAVDRVVLSACIASVEQDTASTPRVFTRYALSGVATGGADEGVQIDAQNQVLYRRLLARDPTEPELAILRDLASPGAPLRDVAISSCYAIGTSVEFLFL